MQMLRICVCYTYADVRHMDMCGVCLNLSFSAEIRKKVELDPKIKPEILEAKNNNFACYTATYEIFYTSIP